MGLYSQEQIAVIRRNKARVARAWEFRFTSETVCIWNGNVDRRFADNPNKFVGMRGQLEAPNVPFSSKGENGTAFFRVHGLPSYIKKMMWDAQAEVYGNYIIEYAMILDRQTLQLVGPMVLNQVYVMRRLRAARQGPTVGGGSPSYSLSILVATVFEHRAEAAYGRYTEADQKGRYPDLGDKIFNYAPVIARGTPIKLV
ncbi:hypothetical protein PsAD5_02529 [Pseudovibrio sp. Ad5]|uniref:hypothetical protein n=1 Tax=Pseudovibrio sp. Ad5 TaxID=989436 RepID=UPI0007AE8DF3|nr:hypothetical protein [Pseudovibrio sp. Ad5]KZK96342.1 hypothetical protein PsAD5_02529 [Pseudovibrio sp. Ad5]